MADEGRRADNAPGPDGESELMRRYAEIMADAEVSEEERERLKKRFPEMPAIPTAPEAPKIQVTLPPKPMPPGKRTDGGGANKLAFAVTAASTLTAPILVLAVGGWWLDQKFKTSWIAPLGLMIGLIAGVANLIKIIQKLAE